MGPCVTSTVAFFGGIPIFPKGEVAEELENPYLKNLRWRSSAGRAADS